MTIVSRLQLNLSILAIILSADRSTICSASKSIGGHTMEITNVPFIVSLQEQPSGHFCGGTLLTSSSVLTSCHCVGMLTAGTNPSSVPLRKMKSLTVQAGSQVLANQSKSVQRVKVERIIFHPNCSFMHFRVYDFAILALTSELELNEQVQPVQLFSLDRNEYDLETKRISNDTNAECFVAGWEKNSTKSTDFTVVRMRIIGDGDCRQKLGREESKFLNFSFWNNAQMCTVPNEERKNTSDCTGDSGGPFFCGKYIFGVISYGYDCRFWDAPNAYAKVADFVDWYKMCEIQKVFKPRSSIRDYSSVDAVSGTSVILILPVIAAILYSRVMVHA